MGNKDHPSYNANALDQLQRILYFLRHPRYGFFFFFKFKDQDDVKTAWENEGKQPFLDGMDRDKILCALIEIMVMHRQEDLFHSRDLMVSHN